MTEIVGIDISREDLIADLRQCNKEGTVVGLDTETEGINPRITAAASGAGTISCWSVSTPTHPSVFLWADQLEYFTPWLQSDAPVCGHNIYSFDWHMFANHGITLNGVAGDTLVMSRLLYCSKERSHGLKDLGLNWLGIEQPSFDSLFRRPKHRMQFVQEVRKKQGVVQHLDYRETKRKVGEHKGVPTLLATGERGLFGKALDYIPLSRIPVDYPDRLDSLYEYAAADALITRLLYERFTKELEKVDWKIEK